MSLHDDICVYEVGVCRRTVEMMDLSKPTRNMLVRTETSSRVSFAGVIFCSVSFWTVFSCVGATLSGLLVSIVPTSDSSPTGRVLRGVVGREVMMAIRVLFSLKTDV